MADEKKPEAKSPSVTPAEEPKTGENEKGKGKGDAAVLVAVVSALATLTVAILGFPPLAEWYRGRLPPTPTTVASPTPIIATFIPPYQVPVPPATETPSPSRTPVASVVSPTQVMWVKVDLDVQPRYDGKVPFRVTFNLQSSKFHLANGDDVYCRNVNTCQYSWKIYRNNVFIQEFNNADGILVYTFTAHGTYIVKVEVCQDTACREDQAEIIVK